MDAIIKYWNQGELETNRERWSKSLAEKIAAAAVATAAADRGERLIYGSRRTMFRQRELARIEAAWSIIQHTNRVNEYIKALNMDLYTPDKVEKILVIAHRYGHKKVIQALIDTTNFEKWSGLSGGNYTGVEGLKILKDYKAVKLAKQHAKLTEQKAKIAKQKAKCSAKDGPLPSIGPPTILTAVDHDVYRYEWPELWPDFRCVITEDRKDSVYGWLREYGDFFYKTGGNGMSERKVIVVSTPQEIEIKLVYLGNASGICTLAVASVLYAVLDRINKKGHFPTRGKVYIESMNGCRAFNCYDRAFQINGFSLEPKNQYKDVQEYAQNGNGGSGEFMYTLHYKRNKALEKVEAVKYHQYVKGI